MSDYFEVNLARTRDPEDMLGPFEIEPDWDLDRKRRMEDERCDGER